MSEQTPDTNNGLSDGQDPSMEDILASIRKIIAEDDVQPDASLSANVDITETKPLTGDVSELASADYLDLDIIEEDVATADLNEVAQPQTDSTLADIDALIGDMDVQGSDDIEVSGFEPLATVEAESDDVLDLMIPMDETEIAIDESKTLEAEDVLELEGPLELDDNILDLTADIEETVGVADVMPSELSPVIPDDMAQDDLSLMLDNMLEDTLPEQVIAAPLAEAPMNDEAAFDPADDVAVEDDLLSEIDLTFEEDVADMTADATETDPDIDLVKSLMADLTEEPLHDDVVETAEETTAIDIDEVDGSTDDVMDEILSMTFEDEAQLSEDLEIPEIPPSITPDEPAEALSLKEIAAQASADAESSQPGLMSGAAALAAISAVGAAATLSSHDDDAADAPDDIETAMSEFDDLLDIETDDSEDFIEIDLLPEEPVILSPEPLMQETPEMPRAAKTDTIIDDVTETETAGAFASLTNIVEEKAVKAERGDRIGDLVMEALQPMLKEWLDANLKGIVERAVTKEVKRISSGK